MHAGRKWKFCGEKNREKGQPPRKNKTIEISSAFQRFRQKCLFYKPKQTRKVLYVALRQIQG